MKIAVLATGLVKEEMQQKPVAAEVSLAWIESMDALIDIADADAYFDLDFAPDDKRINQLSKLLPKPVFINAVVVTLNAINKTFTRINAWPGFLKRNVCEAVAPDEKQKKISEEIFTRMKWGYQFVPDVPGMVSARMIAMIVNEAYYALQEEVSTKTEIDIAMKLGTNYPYGPFEWSDKIGLKNIYDLLGELGKTDVRYEIAEALVKEIKK
jgi:3-hydroxybutyryl-CoA dehydrogenase